MIENAATPKTLVDLYILVHFLEEARERRREEVSSFPVRLNTSTLLLLCRFPFLRGRQRPRCPLPVEVARQPLPAPVVLPVDVRAGRRHGRDARRQVHLEHERQGAVGGRGGDLVFFLLSVAVAISVLVLPRRRGIERLLVRPVRGPGEVQGGSAGQETASRLAIVA